MHGDPGELEKRARLVTHLMLRRSLRFIGWSALFFGLMTVTLAFAEFTPAPTRLLLIGAEAVMFAGGIWLILLPSGYPLIVTAAPMGLIGILCGLQFFASINAGKTEIVLIPAALFMIFIAHRSISAFFHMRSLPRSDPPKADLRALEREIKELKQASMAQNPNVIEFRVKRGLLEEVWKARFMGEEALIIDSSLRNIAFGKRGDVPLVKLGEPKGEMLNVAFHPGEAVLPCRMSREAFERYQAWNCAES